MLERAALGLGTEAVKLIASIVVIGAIAFGGWRLWDGYQDDMRELKELRTYKVSVELQNKISDKAGGNFNAATAIAEQESAAIRSQRAIIEQLTERIAHEDKPTADFLDMPIPVRMRDADRAAREQRQLELGQSAR